MPNSIAMAEADPPPMYTKNDPELEKQPPSYPIDTTAGRFTSTIVSSSSPSQPPPSHQNTLAQQHSSAQQELGGQEAINIYSLNDDEDPISHTIRRNLLLTQISVFVMWIPAIINLAFAQMMSADLKHDTLDSNCGSNYIYNADEPWDPTTFDFDAPGRYHTQCRQLYSWSQLLTAACGLALARCLLQMLPVSGTTRSNRSSSSLSASPPSLSYAIRTAYSAMLTILHIACAFILGLSKLMTGPPAKYESYKPQFSVCLASVCVMGVVCLHQALSTGIAGWKLRVRRGGGGPSEMARWTAARANV